MIYVLFYSFLFFLFLFAVYFIVMETIGRHKANWVTISSDEYESMKSTIEVLSDPSLMKQLKQSEEDVKKGRVKKWEDFVKGFKS
jgi:hypothetical protein